MKTDLYNLGLVLGLSLERVTDLQGRFSTLEFCDQIVNYWLQTSGQCDNYGYDSQLEESSASSQTPESWADWTSRPYCQGTAGSYLEFLGLELSLVLQVFVSNPIIYLFRATPKSSIIVPNMTTIIVVPTLFSCSDCVNMSPD